MFQQDLSQVVGMEKWLHHLYIVSKNQSKCVYNSAYQKTSNCSKGISLSLNSTAKFWVFFVLWQFIKIFPQDLPTVQNSMEAWLLGRIVSNLTEYPTLVPSISALSLATLSATLTALIRRGCHRKSTQQN